jgi:hypothetical protein
MFYLLNRFCIKLFRESNQTHHELVNLFRGSNAAGCRMQNEMQNNLATPRPALQPQLRLLDRVRNQMRVLQYSIRTESAYVDWIT